MAKDNVHIINVNTDEARKSLKELKKDIEASAIALAKMKAAGEDTAEAEEELARQQNILNEAMRLAKKAGKDAEGSYNALSKQMSELRKQWKATGDEAEREDLAAKILTINNQLKQMDASVGVFNRNVGNYGNALGQAFTQFGGVLGGKVTNGIKSANGALKVMSANPIMAVLSVLVGVLSKVVSSLKSSEENADKVTQSFGAFKAIGDILTVALQGLGKIVVGIGEAFAKLVGRMAETLPFMDKINERMKERNEIAEKELALKHASRDESVEIAQLEYEISEARAKAAQKDKYTASERIAFLEEAAQKEQSISQKRVELAKQELDIAEQQARQAGNSAEENDAIAAARVKVINAQRDYNNKVRELNSQISEARNQEATEAAKAAKEAEERAKARAEAEAKAMSVISKATEGMQSPEAITAAIGEQTAVLLAGYDAQIRANNDKNEQIILADKRTAEERKAIMQGYVAATMTLMGSLADILESGTTENEKAAKAAKALRIAEATVNTISGAVAAYMDSVKTYGQPAGPIIGAVQAAAVTAAGMAQIASMRAVTIDKNAGATATASATTATPRVVAPPRIEPSVTSAANTTSAQEDQQLNAQRVVLVYSDVEAAANHVRVVRSEATF